MRLQRDWVVLVCAAAVAASGCASTAGPTAAPTAVRAGIRAEEVPPAPRQADAAVRDAWAAMLRGQPGVALAAADEATSAAMALAGYRALLAGDLQAARGAFASALAADPGMAVAAYGTGLLAQSQGQDDVARQWYEQALQLDATLARAEVAARRIDLSTIAPLLAAAESAAAAGDGESAVENLRQASDRAPWLASPYLQLAELQQSQGQLEAAVATLETGRRLTGDEVAILERLGALYGEDGRWAEANETWQRAAALRPGDARIQTMAAESRRRFEEASLPAEYRVLADKPVITREELAAVLAIHLQMLRPPADLRQGVIIADAGDRWSTPFVYRMVSWGIMDVYQNNTFWPGMEVRRSMLAESAWRVAQLIGAAEGAPRPRIDDPPAEHLLYRPLQVVVGLELMDLEAERSFDLLRPVSGREAIDVAERLAALVRERQR